MEASALKHAPPVAIADPARATRAATRHAPLLRLQSDERLIALVRRGSHAAFEALVARYQARLLAFCRHMLGSREDAEDVLQEVFAAAFNAIVADERPINARPWLYRIARNRSLNHLRRVQPIGVDSMDIHFSEGGTTTADKVHRREEFRMLIADVQQLPESQKTALLLREIDALSYELIAEAMETTIPSVKSLLVRARISLAEAAEARQLTCADVREELGEVAEGLCRSTPSARRHLRRCERCQTFKSQLRSTNRALAAVFPVGPLLLAKKLLFAHFGMSASAGAGSAAGTAAAGVAATGGTSAMSAGVSTIATKAAAGLAAAAIVTAGAVEVKHVQTHPPARAAAAATARAPAAAAEPEVVASTAQPEHPTAIAVGTPAKHDTSATKPAESDKPAEPVAGGSSTEPAADTQTAPVAPLAPVQEESQSVTVQPPSEAPQQTGGAPAPAQATPEASPPSDATPAPVREPPVAPQETTGSVTAAGSGGVTARLVPRLRGRHRHGRGPA